MTKIQNRKNPDSPAKGSIDGAKAFEPTSDEFPKLKRFAIVELLGEGGMGSVYKAWDAALERWIAVKLLRSLSPDLIERFSREARAQARVQHDHICPVYEVGDEDGRPFIAMALVEGIDLRQALPQMSSEQKVRIFIDIADALHAAHRTGLIHRDVKPSNIMVEHHDQSGWHAWVMDFGIAREISEDGSTATGVVMGTPAYMAPEQVSGLRGTTDRRTDVYGLGATLYEAFTDEPPFTGVTGIEILLHVASDEPRPPRSLAPSISVDLETIILKCLEKDQRRRYDTAQALGNDLQRFLDGDPILARRAEWSYIIAKRIRKHKVLATVAAVSFIAIMTLSGITAMTTLRAREKTDLARRFGQQMTRMETSLRIASLLPLHDVRPEKEQVRSQMGDIKEQMSRIGAVAKGPGNYILGRGHLALGELQQARTNLETAWHEGYTTPETAYALGLTLGSLYEDERSRIRTILDDAAKSAELDRLHHELRDPALEYLQTTVDLPPAGRAYAEGLIALYEQRWDDALTMTHTAINLDSALFEAMLLEGQIHMSRGEHLVDQGEFDEAEVAYDLATQALQFAVETARSDPFIHGARCELNNRTMELAKLRGHFGVELYEEALGTCSEALRVDPDHSETIANMAQVHWRWAENLMNQGKDPVPTLEEAIRFARRATEANPQSHSAFNDLGMAFSTLAYHSMKSGKEPAKAFDQAIAAFDQAKLINPRAWDPFNYCGLAWWRMGNWQDSLGIDPLESWQYATKNYETALECFPKSTFSLANLGALRLTMALYEINRGIDPNTSLDEAIIAFTSALELNPKLAAVLSNLGATHSVRAEWQLKNGIDPRPSITKAIVIFERSAEINPRNPRVYNNLGSAAASQASYEYRSNLDGTASLSRAIVFFDKAHELDPRNITALTNRAEAHRMRARIKCDHEEDPQAEIAAALSDLASLITINPRISGAYLAKAQLARLQFEWGAKQGSEPRQFLDLAEKATDQALMIKADDAGAYIEKSRILLLRARGSTHQERTTFLQRGSAAAQKALELNAENAEANMMYGAHALRQAQEEDDPSLKATLVDSAIAALQKGLELDPLFEGEFGKDLIEAQRLTKSQ